MLACIVLVSIWIPRKVRQVVGPSTFSSLSGALMLLHSDNILERFLAQIGELAGPAVKKNHLSSAAGVEHCSCVAESSGGNWKTG